MAVALLKHHFCRRSGAGPKAHAHAAYLSGTKLDDGHGKTADFTPKGGILHAEFWVPENAPSWAKDRGEFWRWLEAREDKTTRPTTAIVAHKFIGALPHELSLEENIRYVKDFVREQFTRKGYAADWAIHAPDPGSDNRNYHVHIMVPLRKIENGNFAKTKDRFAKNSPALSFFIKAKQEAFFSLQNRYLQKNGFSVYISRQDGKWTVVQGMRPSQNPGRPDAQKMGPSPFASLYGRKPSFVANPIIRPSQSNANTKWSSSIRKTFARAAIETTGQTTINPGAFSFSSKKGWPEAAVRDWESWGSKNPDRFFSIWTELSPEGYSPKGGPRP